MNTPSRTRTIPVAMALAILLTGDASLAAGKTGDRASRKPAASPNATNTFTVTGMHCGGCASGICSELKRTPGVSNASVTLTNGLAVVAFDTNRVTTAGLVKVIEEAGYHATPKP